MGLVYKSCDDWGVASEQTSKKREGESLTAVKRPPCLLSIGI